MSSGPSNTRPVAPLGGAGITARVQSFVTTAQLVKTILILIIGAVTSCLVVYKHFAKSYELEELACKVVEQNEINNEMINTSRQIQTALKLLKDNFENSGDRPISTQFIAKEIAVTVDQIGKSLATVNATRLAAQKKAITKDSKC